MNNPTLLVKNFLKDVLRWLYWYPIRLSTRFIPKFYFLKLINHIAKAIPYLASQRVGELAELYCQVKGPSPTIPCRQAVAKTFAHKYMDYAEVFYFPGMHPENIENLTSIVGRNYLDEALAQGKGVILTFFHFGAQKIIMPALGHRGYTIHQFAAPPTILKDIPGATKMFKHSLDLEYACERDFPVTFHYTGNSLRPIYRCLEKGDILLFALDGAFGSTRRLTIPLGNLPLEVSTTIFHLAIKSGAPILPAFMIRTPEFKQELRIHQPLSPDLYALDTDFPKAANALCSLLSTYMDEFPYHYLNQLWFIDKLKETQPPSRENADQ